MKRLATISIAFLLFIPFASIHGNNVTFVEKLGNVLYVGGNGNGNYSSIQAAINAAENGSTIYVYPGYYNESVVINKSISLIGIIKNGEKPVIDGGERFFAVNITADGCILKNFKILNSENKSKQEFKFTLQVFSNENLIENNTIDLDALYMNTATVFLYHPFHNKLINNTLTAYLGYIIYIDEGSDNLIEGNKISSRTSQWIGITMDHSRNNTITKNVITKVLHGINTWSSSYNTISYNKICYNSQYGMGIEGNHNKIIGNNISHNGCDGILISDGSYNLVYGNIISHNGWKGLELFPLRYANYTKIIYNEISYNGLGGLFIYDRCKGTIVEKNNFIKNKKFNAQFVIPDLSYRAIWDANYWSNWHWRIPKPILGFKIGLGMPRLSFDWHPAMQPYKIN